MWIFEILFLVLTILLLVIGIKKKNMIIISLGSLSCILLLAYAVPEFVKGFINGWNS